jgi:hypothetical protein
MKLFFVSILALAAPFFGVSCAVVGARENHLPEITYPYSASAERAAFILNGYLLVKVGMSQAEVDEIFPGPDEVNPVYDAVKQGEKIGYSHVYLLKREQKHGSMNERKEHLVRIGFDLNHRVVRIDKW